MYTLTLQLEELEVYDEETCEFHCFESEKITFNYSLDAISKWEHFYKKAYFVDDERTEDEILTLIHCMVINNDISKNVLLHRLTDKNFEQIKDYVTDSCTAIVFKEVEQDFNRRVTSDMVYYWMTALQIPFECQHWHLNKLLALIKVCNIENKPKQKMNHEDIKARNLKWRNQYRAKHRK